MPRVRHALWLAGGWLLIAPALLPPLMFLLTGTGLAIVLLAVPPFIAGLLVIRSTRLARFVGVLVATTYGILAALVATTPLRGLTPALGQPQPALDPGPVMLAVALSVAAGLILVGKPSGRR